MYGMKQIPNQIFFFFFGWFSISFLGKDWKLGVSWVADFHVVVDLDLDREERVRFWSDPDTELKLAQGTHSKVFRMGVDWSRIMPIEPVDGVEHAVSDFSGFEMVGFV